MAAESSTLTHERFRAECRAALIYFALSLGYFATALWPGRVLFGTDYFAGSYAFHERVAAMLRAGELAIWVPEIYGGLPLFANPGGTFHPVQLLASLLLPTGKILPVVLFVQFALAGFGTYLLARELGCRDATALVMGLCYQFTGVTSSWVYAGHDGRIIVATLAPLVFACLHRGLSSGRVAPFVGASAAIGCSLLSFQIQNAWYCLLAAGLWTLFLLHQQRAQLGVRERVRRLALALAAVGFAFALSAVNFLPFAQYVALSPRGMDDGRGYEYATSYSASPLDLVGMVAPEQVGSSIRDPETDDAPFPAYRGANGFKLHSEYVGALVILLVLAGAFYTRRDPRFRFFAALGAFFLTLALGSNTPLYRLYYAALPGLSRFRAPDLAFYVVALCLVAMAALTLERLFCLRDEGHAFSRRAVLPLVAAAVVIAPLGLAGYAWFNPPQGFDAALAHRIALGWLRFAGFAALVVGVLVSFLRAKLEARHALALLAVVCVADAWTIGRRFLYTLPAEVLSLDHDADDIARFLSEQTDLARVWLVPIPQSYRGGHNLFMRYGLQQAGGEHPLPLQRYVEYFGTSPRRTVDWHNLFEEPQRIETASGPELRFKTRPALLDAANIRFLVSVVPLQIAGLRQVFRGEEGFVYENPGALPRAFLVPDAREVDDPESMLAAMREPTWDPRKLVYVEHEKPSGLGSSSRPLQAQTQVTEYTAQHVVIRARSDRPALLVLSDNYHPDWQVTVDAKPATLLRANHSFRAVFVTAGEHEVDFKFRPRALYIGFYCYVVCFALLAGFALVRLLPRRAHSRAEVRA
jgi:hypothetical protein